MQKRIIYFYDIITSAKGQSRAAGNEADFVTPPKPLSEIFEHVRDLTQGGDNILQKGYTADAESLYLADFSIDQEKVILLINRSDPKAPNSVSSDPFTKSRVVHEKPKGHGGEFSAHVIIFLPPVRGDNHYLCIFESAYGSGLNASRIKSYLAHIIRHCKKQKPSLYKTPNINGARTPRGLPLMVHHNHEVDFRGHPSDQFQKDLSDGRLSSIELVSYSQVGATWDDRGFIKERKRTVELEPSSDLIGDVMSSIRGVRNRITKQHREYKQLRIKFITAEGTQKDATISADTGELYAAEKYVKKHQLGIPLVNSNSFDNIQNYVVKKMLELIG
ncbi:hypothetical protein SAMN05216201_10965 [Pseudomonas linyingensis]|uniref:Uncharacterized protein n=1 Tax=Pseudomonas linyingensis TaxID=915471 RepID=A0A1H6YYI0_9PSED|nr:hypothetical protein [Pseudomonas linyingensis]SEJ46278.1 hypothetical protein SAMN05216201_10965 [Pseudomonas linyingensis]